MDSDPRLACRLQTQRFSQSKLHLPTGRHRVCGTRDRSTASRLVSSAVQLVGTGRFDRDRATAELHTGEVDRELLRTSRRSLRSLHIARQLGASREDHLSICSDVFLEFRGERRAGLIDRRDRLERPHDQRSASGNGCRIGLPENYPNESRDRSQVKDHRLHWSSLSDSDAKAIGLLTYAAGAAASLFALTQTLEFIGNQGALKTNRPPMKGGRLTQREKSLQLKMDSDTGAN